MVDIDDYVPARRYLAPRTSSLWRWDQATAEAVVWSEGGTIVFRQELAPVLARLADRGLPPMNALVWLLGACREGWAETASNLLAQAGLLASVDRCDLPDWLPQLMAQLDAIHALPAELRTMSAAKAELAAMIFEESRPEVGPGDSQRIVRVLSDYNEPGLVASQPGRQHRFSEVLAELRLVYDGLKKFDADAFRLRFQTGLEAPIEPADVDLDPAERTRQFIARLQDDDELGGLARIAKHLMAAIHLPRAISDREDLPVGGVSDISNRGPLDRLLLSELAHDDLTLAVRIAMNEALFLRRETPPSKPPKHRAVLLDSGVRLWGVPRVFATAVGMALTANTQKNVRTDCFRADGERVSPVSLADRAGLVAHLEKLEPEAHPGKSLPAFASTAMAEAGLLDAVIVTGEDVAADHDFQRSLAALELPSVLLATVSREGRFRLIAQGRRGSKLLREATLDLEKLLARPVRRRAPLIDPTVPAGLPAILAVRPFPLLLSYHQPFEPARAWQSPWGGILSISKDRCLFHWQLPNRGARLVSDQAPRGMVYWTGTIAEGAVSLAVVGVLHEKSLWLVRIDSRHDTCESLKLDLGNGRPKAVSGHAGTIFVIYPERIDAFRSTDGTRFETTPIPGGMAWQRDRFFANPLRWYALSFDGLKPVFEFLLPTKSIPAQNDVLAFFDVPGSEGPIGLLADGSLFRPGDALRVEVNHGLGQAVKLTAISYWGNAVVISDPGGMQHRMVSLPDGRVRHGYGMQYWLDHNSLDIARFARPQAVRNRFLKIFTDSQGRLGLISRKSESVITLLADRQLFLQSRRAETPDKRAIAVFHSTAAPQGVGYSLQLAKWKDGSLAWLDSRGMLHLRSSDRSIPEVSLVLRDGALAGWTSEGWIFGLSYFTGKTPLEARTDAYHNILQLPHVLAGRARYHSGDTEADVYHNILERFTALLQ